MKEFTSCKEGVASCIAQKYFTIAHQYNEEKTLNMHIHDCYEIYYSISGGKQFLIDNRFYAIRPGDVFFINNYESHLISKIDKMVHERIVLSIHPELIKQLSTDKSDLGYCFSYRKEGFSHRVSLDKEQQQRFHYYIHKITSAEGLWADLTERATFVELMVLLNKAFYNQCMSRSEEHPYRYNRQVDLILKYVNRHISEPITIGQMSKQFFLSESYICRIFKSTTGTTFNKYLTARRISMAKSLLVQGMNVSEVCERCGFNDYSNFLKAFTKTVGLSPKKFAQYSVR